jgi:hypothetical protein
MQDLKMGLWTGVLGGAVTAVIATSLDLVTGAGLDAAARAGGRLGAEGPAAPLLALLVLAPAFAVVIGVVLSRLPARIAGTASGLVVGLAVGLLAALPVARADLDALGGDALGVLALGLASGLVTGFLYSRYARTRRRPASSRPFARS